jgi:hypothetical protein
LSRNSTLLSSSRISAASSGKRSPCARWTPREPPDQPVDFDEIAQDLEDPRGAAHDAKYMGRSRAFA